MRPTKNDPQQQHVESHEVQCSIPKQSAGLIHTGTHTMNSYVSAHRMLPISSVSKQNSAGLC
jgi:hypothetical protein